MAETPGRSLLRRWRSFLLEHRVRDYLARQEVGHDEQDAILDVWRPVLQGVAVEESLNLSRLREELTRRTTLAIQRGNLLVRDLPPALQEFPELVLPTYHAGAATRLLVTTAWCTIVLAASGAFSGLGMQFGPFALVLAVGAVVAVSGFMGSVVQGRLSGNLLDHHHPLVDGFIVEVDSPLPTWKEARLLPQFAEEVVLPRILRQQLRLQRQLDQMMATRSNPRDLWDTLPPGKVMAPAVRREFEQRLRALAERQLAIQAPLESALDRLRELEREVRQRLDALKEVRATGALLEEIDTLPDASARHHPTATDVDFEADDLLRLIEKTDIALKLHHGEDG